jgi:hypothetical protein
MLQWAQRTGDLGKLLAAMRAADPERFAAIFGPASAELLAVTARGDLGPVAGAVLWKEPWVGRFVAAGRDDVFRAVQRRMAKDGAHFQAAMEAARTLGVATERSITLFFDTAVQQGAGAARTVAEQVRAALTGGGTVTVGYADLLVAYAERAAGRARRATTPTKQPMAPGLVWKQVGGEWHLFAGGIDLYEDVRRRRMGIVRDAGLGDESVDGVCGLTRISGSAGHG